MNALLVGADAKLENWNWANGNRKQLSLDQFGLCVAQLAQKGHVPLWPISITLEA